MFGKVRLLRLGEAAGGKPGHPEVVGGGLPTRLEKHTCYGFRGFAQHHPCIGARAVMNNGNFHYSVLPDMESVLSAIEVIRIIEEYLALTDAVEDPIKTLALIFVDTAGSPREYAQKYWQFLQLVHDVDAINHDWDPSVSSDISAPDFELSLCGRAMFTTTLNPASDRAARRSMYPVWVCNQIRQFDQLRHKGMFGTWQKKIREADSELDPSGKPNPILADHGTASAAGQLAGHPYPELKFQVRKTKEERIAAAHHLLALLKQDEDGADFVPVLQKRMREGLGVTFDP